MREYRHVSLAGDVRHIYQEARGSEDGERCMVAPCPDLADKLKKEVRFLNRSLKSPNVFQEEAKAKAAIELEQVRTQGKKEIETFKVQAKTQENMSKMEADANKEREQRDADLATNLAEMDRQSAIDQQQIAAEQIDHEADRQIERERMTLDYTMHQQDLQSREQVAAHNARMSVQKAQAASIGKAFEKNDRQARQ